MFSSDLKRMISNKVQTILKETGHPEIPGIEIQFLLHVDGIDNDSWANITNNKPAAENEKVPMDLCRNRTV